MYLVIGGTEMIGAHLICTMLKQGMHVSAIRSKYDNTEYTKHVLSFYSIDYIDQYNEIEWRDAELDDPVSLEEAMEGITTIFYCKDPELSSRRSISDNVYEIRNVIDVVRSNQERQFYYVSSMFALGDEPDLKEITETSQRNPKGNYTKRSTTFFRCEMEVRRAMEEGLDAGIINPCVVLGPGDWVNDMSALIELTKSLEVYTDGVTGFVGVNDVVKCLMTMAREKITGENFIVCSQNLCIRELLDTIAKYMGVKMPKAQISKLQLKIMRLKYAIKSLLTGRRPIINDAFFDSITQFKLYSNKKSVNKLIANYQPIDQVIDEICKIYRQDHQH